MHLQRQSSHQRTNRDKPRGKEQASSPRDHVRDVSQHQNSQNRTDEQRVADTLLNLGRVTRAQQVLEDDIGWVGELVLEAVAKVGDVLEFMLAWV
jgi:hypothetical protein